MQENDRSRLMWDVSLPTDWVLVHRHSDITLTLKESNSTLLLEMACCYDSLLEEREKEKRQKYEELAADLALQFPCKISEISATGNRRPGFHRGPGKGIRQHQNLHSQCSPVLQADKCTLFEYKNSETTPFRMSLVHWIKHVSQVL